MDDGEVANPTLPRDVDPGDVGDTPFARARWHLSDAVASLTTLATIEDAEEQAEYLVEHLRRYGDPECCIHGLPMRHMGRPGRDGNPIPVAHKGETCFRWGKVSEVVAWARRLDAVDQGLRAVWRRGTPARWVANELLDLTGLQRIVDGEVKRDGSLSTFRLRQVVEMAGTQLLRDSDLVPMLAWDRGVGPGLALTSSTVAGLYAFCIVDAGGRDEPRPSGTCDVCGRVASRKRPPRPGEVMLCGRPDCIRTHKTRAKRRERAARRGESADA